MAGRPTTYTEEIAAEVCKRIMDGESLKSICEDKHMPVRSTVHLWLADFKHKAFSDNYMKAKECQADTLADEMQYIADNARVDRDAVAKARLQIDTRKWVASKLKPKKYGDKIDHTTNGKDLPTPILGGLTKHVPTDDSD